MISFICRIFKNDKNKFTYKTNILTDLENKLTVTKRGKMEARGIN